MCNVNKGFTELSVNEQFEVEGGDIGLVLGIIGTVITVGTAIYAYGYARGQNAGYHERFGK